MRAEQWLYVHLREIVLHTVSKLTQIPSFGIKTHLALHLSSRALTHSTLSTMSVCHRQIETPFPQQETSILWIKPLLTA